MTHYSFSDGNFKYLISPWHIVVFYLLTLIKNHSNIAYFRIWSTNYLKFNQKLLLFCPQVTELEISGYVSDGENIGDTMTSSRLDSESSPLQTGEGSRRSVSDWVRSAQAMLQTPQKPLARQAKTPEDSAKKKRKFQRFEGSCSFQKTKWAFSLSVNI